MSEYKHWKMHVETTTENTRIAWFGFDRQHERVNSIHDEALDELNDLLQDLSQMPDVQGLIIYSLKSKGFIAGADVNTIARLSTPEQAVDFLRKGQAVFARLEALPIPTVAMINGFCMGGGLELALTCDYRVATDDPETRLGLPEVMLGFHPGWGGTVRLPQLIGGFHALSEVMLSGTALVAKKAKRLGFVDEVVPERQLARAARYYIEKKPQKHQPTLLQSLSNKTWVRTILAHVLRRVVSKKVRKAHYPAPFAMINLWEKEGGYNERAYLKEVDSVEQLIAKHQTAENLIRVFLLRERLKDFAKQSHFKATHVHVIGAGVMGGDIAAWCALRGLRVTLQDKSHEQIAPAIARAKKLYKKKCREPRLIQAAMDRLIPDPEGHGIAHADVIIEAVFEHLETKQTLFKMIESKAKPDALLATNTSSIPLDEISTVMQNPKRLIGIHFFNPVAKMALIEVVESSQTEHLLAQHAYAFVHQIGKLPLPVQSSPGFLINRVLMPYLMECMVLLNEKIPAEVIDEAAQDFGMMMGPVELADTVGLDVCLAVAKNLTSHFGGSVPDVLVQMVEAGKLGRKSGEGFYRYRQGKQLKGKPTKNDDYQRIAQRLIQRMIDESKACIKEGVVADADLLDAGMIFATGFAPFRGGPLRYAQQAHAEKRHHAHVVKEDDVVAVSS